MRAGGAFKLDIINGLREKLSNFPEELRQVQLLCTPVGAHLSCLRPTRYFVHEYSHLPGVVLAAARCLRGWYMPALLHMQNLRGRASQLVRGTSIMFVVPALPADPSEGAEGLPWAGQHPFWAP